jgi:signal transduction histidine kinase
MSRLPLRWRLAGAFALATAVVLAVLGLFLHARLRRELDATLRAGLTQRASDLTPAVRRGDAALGEGGLIEPGDDLAQILDPASGAVVAGARGFDRVPLLTPAEARRAARRPLRIEERRVGDEREPAMLLAAPAGARVVVVGASLEDREDALDKLEGLLLLGLPVALLLASGAGFVVAGRALRPIDRIRARAEDIGAHDLTLRVPEPEADDELRRLAHTLNDLLARLESAFAHERAFVADAGHELRTPLAALKSELELARRPGRGEAELRAAVVSAAEDTERLIRLAEDLLTVARSDTGALPIRRTRVDAPELLARLAARHRGDVTVSAPNTLPVLADPLRLEQAVGNLIANAERHGAAPITLSAGPVAGGAVRISVRDRGPGLAPGLDGRAFERFTRGDTAREGEGAGLGLSIVQAIASAHGGTAGLDQPEEGGVEAWIELPGVSEAASG